MTKQRHDHERYELRPGWTWCVLDDVATSITDGPFGSNLKTADYVDEGVRVIRLGNIGIGEFNDDDRSFISREKFEGLRKHEAVAGDLVIAALAEPVGRACIVPASVGQAIVKADCVRARIHPAVGADLVVRWLNSPEGLKRAALASHGIGRLRINLGEMRALPLPLPPAREQRRIVAKLETLFEQTRAAKARLGRLPALLERFKCSILAAAVRGELTADWRAAHPEVEPASALLDRIRTGRRCRWEDGLRAKGKDPSKATYEDPAGVDMDALPPLPHGWTWASVEQLISEPMCNGISIPGSDTPPGTRSLKLNALTEGGIDFSAVRFIAIDEDTVEQLRLRPGDFLVSRGNGSRHLVGRAVAVDAIPPTPTVYPDTIIRVRFGPALDDTGWIPAIWSSPDIRRQIEARAKTTAGIYKISQNDLGSIRVPLPSVEEQRVVAQRVATAMTSLRTLLATCDGQAERVARLEQAILARAFRGELIPQDPTDEPAAVVLDRIRAARAAEPESPRRARRRETWTKDSA